MTVMEANVIVAEVDAWYMARWAAEQDATNVDAIDLPLIVDDDESEPCDCNMCGMCWNRPARNRRFHGEP